MAAQGSRFFRYRPSQRGGELFEEDVLLSTGSRSPPLHPCARASVLPSIVDTDDLTLLLSDEGELLDEPMNTGKKLASRVLDSAEALRAGGF